MDTSFPARVRAFVDESLIPFERECLSVPFSQVAAGLQLRRDEARRRELFTPHLPASLGGQGLTLLEFARVSEELGRTPYGHFAVNAQAPDIGNMELLHSHGSPAQRERWLAPLARGEIRSCFAMTEPDRAGSNPVWLDTVARRDGNDYVITGRKWFTSGADGAAFAIVMAITNPDAPAHARASQIIVPAGTPGFHLVRNIPVMGDAGDGWASHAEVRFDECRVPRSNRIGDEGTGFVLAQERLGPGRIHHCMRWIGICERALELTCRYAVSRELSPGAPLAQQQAVQHAVADSRAEVDAARLLILEAARSIDRDGASASREQISVIKYFAAGVLQRVLDRAIQVFGARGLTDDTPLAWWFRHERAARIYDGADEVHKTFVARRIFKRYGLSSTKPGES